MQINRLFLIVNKLLNHKIVTAKQLSDDLSVSIRTIYRDIDVLSSAGVPVYYTKGRNGGISLLENYTLSKAILTDEEKSNILLSLSAISAASHIDTKNLTDKLKTIFGSDIPDWINIDFSRQWAKNDNAIYKDISYAIINKLIIDFDYHSITGQTNGRDVEPMQLEYSAKSWYMKGFCLLRNDFRFFKLSRILSLKVTDKKFNRRAMPEITLMEPRLTRVIMEFSKKVAFRLYDEFDSSYITVSGDKYILDAEVPYDEWIVNFTLSFGNDVKVISPEYLITDLLNSVKKIQQLY